MAITGESGSGKSTLLNVISGIAGDDEEDLIYGRMPEKAWEIVGIWNCERKHYSGISSESAD